MLGMMGRKLVWLLVKLGLIQSNFRSIGMLFFSNFYHETKVCNNKIAK